MIDMIGYIALLLALTAMMSKNIYRLRFIHILSCCFYAVYGIVTYSYPVAVGAILFCGIHIYHLLKLKINYGNLK